MSQFIPGQPVVSFFLESSDEEVVIRYPRWEDLHDLHVFINELSSEDTYISFSGEEISLEEEADFLLNWYKKMEFGDGVYLVCELHEKIVGACEISRNEEDRQTISDLRIIKLRAFAENAPAIALYSKLGFVEVGKLPGVVKHADVYLDQVEMCLRLS
jgi:RimJ/RimL family protein N-acetyltransferase